MCIQSGNRDACSRSLTAIVILIAVSIISAFDRGEHAAAPGSELNDRAVGVEPTPRKPERAEARGDQQGLHD